MWVFLTRQIDNNEELRTQLEWVESELAAIRTTSKAQKKQLEEIRVRFTIENEALIENYQKQVDEMFFQGYQCCMRKNGITQYIPSYPSNEEKDATVSGPAQGNKDLDVVGPSDGQ